MELGKEELGKLQLLEQRLQVVLTQKQNFQAQLLELENALKEMKQGKDKVYRIIGNIMIASERDELTKSLNSRNEILNLRIKNLEKQEVALKEEAEDLQKVVLNGLKNEK